MDNEMIELCCIELAQQREQNGAMPYAAYGKHAKENLKEDVIAVIKAMREPTEKMLKAEGVQPSCHMCGGHMEGWQTMIDAVIND